MALDEGSKVVHSRVADLVSLADGTERARFLVTERSRERLIAGHAQYGDWCPGKNWAQEQLEEAIDGLHYALAGAMFATTQYEADVHMRLAESWTQIALAIAEAL